MLGRCGPGVEKKLGAFLALVQLRVDVERPASVDDRVLDGLAHGARDPTQYHVDLAVLDQLADVSDRDFRIGGRVFQVKLDRLAQNSAGGVDLLDGELRHLPVGVTGRSYRAGNVSGDAHLYRTRRVSPAWAQHPATRETRNPAGCSQRACASEEITAGDVAHLICCSHIQHSLRTWFSSLKSADGDETLRTQPNDGKRTHEH